MNNLGTATAEAYVSTLSDTMLNITATKSCITTPFNPLVVTSKSFKRISSTSALVRAIIAYRGLHEV